MIAESIKQESPMNYVETAEEMTRRGDPMTPQRVREIEQRAFRKLAKRFPELIHEAGLADD